MLDAATSKANICLNRVGMGLNPFNSKCICLIPPEIELSLWRIIFCFNG